VGTIRTREVSAAAAPSSTRISWLWKVMRSPQARLENGKLVLHREVIHNAAETAEYLAKHGAKLRR
jgi:hypothetical protein